MNHPDVLVIAARDLNYTDSSERRGKASIEITMPKHDKKSKDWSCNVRIIGVSKEIDRSVYGVDSLQCLTLAFEMVHVQMKFLQRSGYKFSWLGKDGFDFEEINSTCQHA
jgi:hypothetical protein